MKKIVLTLLLASASVFSCLAQNTIQDIGVSAEIGLPTGTASDLYTVAKGANIIFETPTQIRNLQLTASVGYTYLNTKKELVVTKRYTTGTPNANFLPVEVGAKYYRNNFFIQGELGASGALTAAYPGPRVGVLYTPAIGYTMQGFDLDKMDVSLGYQGRSGGDGNTNHVFLRLFYRFHL